MAGQTLGVQTPVLAPVATPSTAAALRTAQRLTLHASQAGTRTRRNHGAFTLGGHLACVYSTRKAGRCCGVSFELGAGTLTLAGSMTPSQARCMARALSAAADAAEAVAQGGAA
ncbi:MAG: hypothetical protein WAP57_13035 [Aquabacterium commune]|uniref:hypothetical protein n=1 Tax=Aquabacterium commune TaxID=70586 RepID=UPI003BB05FF8